MWFKQAQFFQLTAPIPYDAELLAEQLAPLAFKPCLPSLPSTYGWVSPIDQEGAPLVYAANGYLMICMQYQEKILPSIVIRQALQDKVKAIEEIQGIKLGQKQRYALKDEIILTLLPQAFSQFTRIYAYIDTANARLVLDTTHAGKTEKFIALFKKSVSEGVCPYETKKISPILTNWLVHQDYPPHFAIEPSGVLQDIKQETRLIRCQQQDLFADSIGLLIKDGCQIKQLALAFQESVHFILVNDFSLRRIRFQDEIREQVKTIHAETESERFAADFFLMTQTLNELFAQLFSLFVMS